MPFKFHWLTLLVDIFSLQFTEISEYKPSSSYRASPKPSKAIIFGNSYMRFWCFAELRIFGNYQTGRKKY